MGQKKANNLDLITSLNDSDLLMLPDANGKQRKMTFATFKHLVGGNSIPTINEQIYTFLKEHQTAGNNLQIEYTDTGELVNISVSDKLNKIIERFSFAGVVDYVYLKSNIITLNDITAQSVSQEIKPPSAVSNGQLAVIIVKGRNLAGSVINGSSQISISDFEKIGEKDLTIGGATHTYEVYTKGGVNIKANDLVKPLLADEVVLTAELTDGSVKPSKLTGDVEVGLLGVNTKKEFVTRQVTKADLDDQLDDVVDAVDKVVEIQENWIRNNDFQFALSSGQTEAGEVNSTFPNFNFNTTHRLSATETSYIKIISKKDADNKTRQFDEEAERLIDRVSPVTSPTPINLDKFTKLEDYTDSANEVFDAYTSKTAYTFLKNTDWDLQQKEVEPAVKSLANVPDFVKTLPSPVEVGKPLVLGEEVVANGRTLLPGHYLGTHYGSDFEASAVKMTFRLDRGYNVANFRAGLISPLQFVYQFQYRIHDTNNVTKELLINDAYTKNQTKCYIGIYDKNATSNAVQNRVAEFLDSLTRTDEQITLLNGQTYTKWVHTSTDSPQRREWAKLSLNTEYNFVLYRSISEVWNITDAYGVDTGDYYEPLSTYNLIEATPERLPLVDALPETANVGDVVELDKEDLNNNRNLLPGVYEYTGYPDDRAKSGLIGRLINSSNGWKEISLEAGGRSPLQFISSMRFYTNNRSYYEIEVWGNKAYISSNKFVMGLFLEGSDNPLWEQGVVFNQTDDTYTGTNNITYTKFTASDTNFGDHDILNNLVINTSYEVHLFSQFRNNKLNFPDTYRVSVSAAWEPIKATEHSVNPQILGSQVSNRIINENGEPFDASSETLFQMIGFGGVKASGSPYFPANTFDSQSFNVGTTYPLTIQSMQWCKYTDTKFAVLTIENAGTSIGFMVFNNTNASPTGYYNGSLSRLGLTGHKLLALMVQEDYTKTWIAHVSSSANNPQSFTLSRGNNRLDATAQQNPDLTLDTGANAKSFTINKNPTHIESMCHIGQKTNGGVGVALISETIPNLVLVNMSNGALSVLLDPLPQVDGADAKADDYSSVNYNSATKELSLIQNKKKRVIKFTINFTNGDVSGITLQGSDATPTNTINIQDVKSTSTTTSGYQKYSGSAVSRDNRFVYGAFGNKSFKLREYTEGHGTPVVFQYEKEQSILTTPSTIDVPANRLYQSGRNAGYVATRLEFEALGTPLIQSIKRMGFRMDFRRLGATSNKPDWTKKLEIRRYHGVIWEQFDHLPTIEGDAFGVKMSDATWNALTDQEKIWFVQPDDNQLNPPNRALLSGFTPTFRDDAYYCPFVIVVKDGRVQKYVFGVSETSNNFSRIQYEIPHLSDVFMERP